MAKLPPSIIAKFARPSVNNGKLLDNKFTPNANGINAAPIAAIATEPASINGNANPSPAAATPSVTSPAAITPIVPKPTSFIRLNPNAIGTTAAPNRATAAAPLIIAVEPLPSSCATPAKPANAIVPLIIDVKFTSLNFLSPIAASVTAPPNKAKLAAPFTTLLSPNFLTAFAIDFKKPPLLPIGIVALSALSEAPESILDTLPPTPPPPPPPAGVFVSLLINPDAILVTLLAMSFPLLNIC